MEAVECGAASLAMVLAYYGCWTPLEELRIACGVSRDGAKASNVVKAARRYGLEAKGRRLEVDDTLALEMPVIVFWGFNHFLVVEGHNGKYVFLNDPARGPRRVTLEEFDQGFTGVVLELRPGEGFRRQGRRSRLVGTLSSWLRGSGKALAFVAAVSLMLVLPGLVLPAFLKVFVDEVLIRGFGHWLFPVIVGLVLTAILAGVLTYLQQAYLLRTRMKLSIASASRFFWHVLRLPVAFYTQRYVGDVADRENSCQRIAQLLSGPLSTNIVNGMMIFFYAGAMTWYSPVLAGAVVGTSLLLVLLVRLTRRRLRDLNTHLLNQLAKSTGASLAGLQAIETLKATGTEQDFFRLWVGYQTHAVNARQQLGVLSAELSAAPAALANVTTGLVLGLGGWLVIQGQLTIGGLLAFQLLRSAYSAPIQELIGFARQIQEVSGDLTRLNDVFRSPLDPVHRPDPAASPGCGGLLSGAVQMQRVSFSYGPLDPLLIDGFDLTLHPGKRVALVGATGSGKSTLARLLLGLYPPAGGQVLYDGLPIGQIDRESFALSVAAVDQEIFLFEGSVYDNLTLWDPTIPYEDVVRAAKDACIHELIAARPGGYDSRVSEGGANFSGGEAQRIEIARALVRNPALLVLDEATASLDPVTEQQIDDHLRRRGCTCVIVAHRLSTIRDCDEIIMLDAGRVAQRGTHDQLISEGGLYAQLVSAQ